MFPDKILVSTLSNGKDEIPKLTTRKDEICVAYFDVFDGTGCFPGPPYHIQIYPGVTYKQTPC